MNLNIRQQLVSYTNYTFGRNNSKKWLTIHETANRNRGANAAAHANLQSRPNPSPVSWHWQVDDMEAVQSFTHDWQLYHAGDGAGNGNKHSIAIETCIHDGNDWASTKANLIALAIKICRDEGIPIERVVQHNHWSGKNCPTILRSNGNKEWNEVYAAIKAGLAGKPTPAPKPAPAPKPSGKKTVAQMATEIQSGLHGNGHANRQKSLGVDNATYALVRAEVNRRLYGHNPVITPTPKPSPTKTVAKMADEVMAGAHGSGHANRRKSLGVSQAIYEQVRAEVNRRLGISTGSAPKGKSISQMASEVIAGKHGVGHANRQRSLGVDNATYQAVRAEVNRRV